MNDTEDNQLVDATVGLIDQLNEFEKLDPEARDHVLRGIRPQLEELQQLLDEELPDVPAR